MFSVAALARFDGRALIAVGLSLGALSALFFDVAGLALGVLGALGGWVELRGVALLADRPAAARRRMIGAQAIVFGSPALYCAWSAHRFDARPYRCIQRPCVYLSQRIEVSPLARSVAQYPNRAGPATVAELFLVGRCAPSQHPA